MIRRHTQNELLLTPGPTEVDPVVLKAASHVAESHFSQGFCDTFGDTLTLVRKLFQCEDPKAQPFVLAGSGSLGWDFIATNFLEPGDAVLCLSTGFFSDAFEKCLTTYGLRTKKLQPPFGGALNLREVEEELRSHPYKALIATHVETSTAVLTHLKPLSDLIKRVSPETLFFVDGVASIGCEEFHFDALNVDAVVTGSQKALSCPPGLAIIMVSRKALGAAERRQAPPATWYSSLNRWLPIMRSYENKQTSYFATPPTQLVHALHASLTSILSQPLNDRFQQHQRKAAHVREAIERLGLLPVSSNPDCQANGVTAFWLPPGLTSKTLLSELAAKGVVLAAGMHAEFGSSYARFGHMGFSAVDDDGRRVDEGLEILKETIMNFYAKQDAELLAQDLIPLNRELASQIEPIAV